MRRKKNSNNNVLLKKAKVKFTFDFDISDLCFHKKINGFFPISGSSVDNTYFFVDNIYFPTFKSLKNGIGIIYIYSNCSDISINFIFDFILKNNNIFYIDTCSKDGKFIEVGFNSIKLISLED